MPDGDDARVMTEALALAREGWYSAAPNPRVGCILVRDGREIARGCHHRAGEAHAEAAALAQAASRGVDVRGATAYVTLEPCSHTGRTPPCTEALAEAGVARVVYAVDDPNPAVSGTGAERLRQAGIDVVVGVLAGEAAALNRGFFTRMRAGRPHVRVKLAMSLDGAVALDSGESQWISGPGARADVQRLRAESCAVVTGIGTVLSDDPSLNVRDQRFEMRGREPLRIVLDSHLRMPPLARMLKLPGETRVFHAGLVEPDPALAAAGARVESLPGVSGRVDLGALLERLAELELNDVLVESGPTLAGAFIDGGWFDELVIYIAPKLLGRTARRAFDTESPEHLAGAMGLDLIEAERCGEDLRLTLGRYARPKPDETG